MNKLFALILMRERHQPERSPANLLTKYIINNRGQIDTRLKWQRAGCIAGPLVAEAAVYPIHQPQVERIPVMIAFVRLYSRDDGESEINGRNDLN